MKRTKEGFATRENAHGEYIFDNLLTLEVTTRLRKYKCDKPSQGTTQLNYHKTFKPCER